MVKNRRISIFLVIVLFVMFLFIPDSVESKTRSKSSSKTSKSKASSRKKKSRYHKRYRRKRKSRRRRTSRRKKYRRKAQVGILVESEQGKIIEDKLSSVPFNPASAIKVLTAYGALKKLGPTYRFSTDLFIDGDLDLSTGVLDGNVYVRGKDPEFSKSDSIDLVKALNDRGIKKVKGKIVVSKLFSLYSSRNALVSARGLVKVFKYAIAGKSVEVLGKPEVGAIPDTARLVLHHESEMLSYTLREVLSRSLNSTAERIGDVIGGVNELRRVVVQDLKITDKNIRIETASGLGHNRITPKQMMIILRSFARELENHGLRLHNVLAIGGLTGTLEKRFTQQTEKSSIAAKTGTLSHTDGGVSALVGVAGAQKEKLYFVIFSWRGGVYSMRKQQDQIVTKLQKERGGPKSFIPVTVKPKSEPTK